jgi:hypothetical protein
VHEKNSGDGLLFFVMGIVRLANPEFSYHHTEEVAKVGTRLNFKKSSVLLADGRFGLVEGVVGRADQGASFYVLEAHLFAQNFVL